MRDLNDDVKKYLDQLPAEKFTDQELATIIEKSEINKQSQRKPKLVLWQKFAVVCCCLLAIVPCVLLPILLKPQRQEPYYGDDEVTQTDLERSFVEEYFQQNFPQYSFIFEECDINNMSGIYETKSNKLVAINLTVRKKAIPKTPLEINLILDRRYKYGQHDRYIDEAEISNKEDYVLYRRDVGTFNKTEIWALIEHQNYKLYLLFDLKDENFFEKFL